MIRAYRWKADTHCGEHLRAGDFAQNYQALRASGDVLWVDLESPTPEEEDLVFEKFFDVHTLTKDDVLHPRHQPDQPPHFPKVEEFPDYLFIVVNPLSRRLLENVKLVGRENADVLFENGSVVTQLSAVLTHTLLITHHYEPVRGIDYLREHVEKHKGCAARGPDFLFHIVLDQMVDEYAPVLDHFSEALEDYELKMFRKPKPRMITRLVEAKRAIILLRKTLVYEREILARLARGDFELIDEREAVYYRNVYDHLIRFTELIEASREMVGDLLQMHLAASSNRLNEVMKVLAMISTIVLPMTLIAGVYGMNFERLAPRVDTPYGFEIALGLMLLSGIVSLAFFKWKKWF